MILIERTTATGYEEKEYEETEALQILNNELQNKRTVWIDNLPYFGDFINLEDIKKCKNSISVTNKLVGG